MYSLRCPKCNASVNAANWNRHQKTLHYSEEIRVHCCPVCPFKTQVLAYAFCHAFLEGHELPKMPPRSLRAVIPLPTGPQRVPLRRKSAPLAKFKNTSPSSKNSKPLTKATSKPGNQVPVEESSANKSGTESKIQDDDIVITSDSRSIAKATHKTPRKPEPSEIRSRLDDNQSGLARCLSTKPSAMFPEERPESPQVSPEEQEHAREQSAKISPKFRAIEMSDDDEANELMLLNKTVEWQSITSVETSTTDSATDATMTTNNTAMTATEATITDTDTTMTTETTETAKTAIEAANDTVTDSEDLNQTVGNTIVITSSTLAIKTAECAKCSQKVVFENHSCLIRHSLSCNNICLFNCRVCKGSWPTAESARRHLIYCRARGIEKPNFTVYKFESLRGLKTCFPDMDQIGSLNKELSETKSDTTITGFRPDMISMTSTPQKPQDAPSNVSQYFSPRLERIERPANKTMTRLEVKQKEENLKCNQCSRMVKMVHAVYHIMRCLKILPFRCNGCGSEFRAKNYLTRSHMLTFRCLGAELELVQDKAKAEAIRSGFDICFPGYDHKWPGFSGPLQFSEGNMKCDRCSAVVPRHKPMQHVVRCLNLRPYLCKPCGHRTAAENYARHHRSRCSPGAEIVMDQKDEVDKGLTLCFPNYKRD